METKFCENCGAKMPIESKFCTECGTPFPKAEPKKEQPAPAPVPAEQPAEQPTEQPAETPVEQPVETPAETPYEEPIDLPRRDPEPAPYGYPAQAQTAQPAQPAQPVNPNPQPVNPNPIPAQPVNPNPQPVRPAPAAAAMNPTPTPAAAPMYNPAPAYASMDPEITKETVKGTKFEPVSALGWFGIFLLCGIPLVGPLLVIIWACGGCRKQNKRTYARGILISWLVGALIAGLIGLALRSRILDFAKKYAAENGIQYSESAPLTDILNSVLNQYGYEIVK